MSNLSLGVAKFEIEELPDWANIAVVEPSSRFNLCRDIASRFKRQDGVELLTLTAEDKDDWPWFLQSAREEDAGEDERSTVVVLDELINASNFDRPEYRSALTNSALGTITQVQSLNDLPFCSWYEDMMPFDYVFFRMDSESEIRKLWQLYLSNYVAYPLFKSIADYSESSWIVVEAIGNETKLYRFGSHWTAQSDPIASENTSTSEDNAYTLTSMWRWMTWK